MDLSTMGAKLEEGMYKDRFAFQADFRLMVNNAKLYNLAGSYVHNEAISLEVFFEKRSCLIMSCVIHSKLSVQNGQSSTRLWKQPIKPILLLSLSVRSQLLVSLLLPKDAPLLRLAFLLPPNPLLPKLLVEPKHPLPHHHPVP